MMALDFTRPERLDGRDDCPLAESARAFCNIKIGRNTAPNRIFKT